MSCQRIEVEIEPIAGEKGNTARGQAPSQGVDHRMGHVLRTKTELKHGQNLGARIDNQPQPEHLGWSGGAWCEFCPAAGAGGAGCGSSAHGRAQRAFPRE